MSYRVVGPVLDRGPVDPIETLLMVALAETSNDEGWGFPGVELLAKRCRRGQRQTLRILERLEKNGWLKTIKHAAGAHKRQTAFQLNMPRLQGLTSDPQMTHDTRSTSDLQVTPVNRTTTDTQISHDTAMTRDISRGRQVTSEALTSDISPKEILINHRTVEPKDTPVSSERVFVLTPRQPSRDEMLRGIIKRSFDLYTELVGRDPKRYGLSDKRMAQGLKRAAERASAHKGDLQAAERDLQTAIRNLSESSWHRANNQLGWELIFRSQDDFEAKLNLTSCGRQPRTTPQILYSDPEAMNAR